MENAQPRLWIESTWLPVEVLEEIAPKKPRFSGYLVVMVAPAAEDGGLVWEKYGGKRLKLPAYMVYNYTATVVGVKPNRANQKALGGYGALKGHKAIDRPTVQTDKIIDMDNVEGSPNVSTAGPTMYEGAGAEVVESLVSEPSVQTDTIEEE